MINAPTKILFVEHDLNDVELMRHELDLGGIQYISEVVQNEPTYVAAINYFKPDIILADYTFPSFSGLQAFKIKQHMAPDTPFIFVSGTIGEEKSIELIKNGVTDYALKDKLFTLCPKVIRALKEAKEKKQKEKAEQELIQNERWLARAQQLAQMGNWEFDFTTNDIRLSDEACRIYGLPNNQNRQSFETMLSFIYPEDLENVLNKIKEARASLSDSSATYRIIHRNKSIRHIYSESKQEFDSNGRLTGLYGIAHDITKAVLLEQKLVQERRAKQSEITAAVLTAQENERAHIGKELHENLNQILAVANMYLKMAKTDTEDGQIYLEKSSGMIMNVIAEIRRISKTLLIPDILIFGLFGNIRNLLSNFTAQDPIKIKFHEKGIKEADLDEKLQLAIFRVIQEQVNNILKHAKATKATIYLSRRNNEVLLLISDNGKGCGSSEEIKGVGIKNIRSRAELHNGKVNIESNPGQGFKLEVSFSLNTTMNTPELLPRFVAP